MKIDIQKVGLRNIVLACVSLLFPLLIILLRPFSFSYSQAWVLAGCVFAVEMWITGAIPRIITSTILLIVFFIFGNTPIKEVLHFPLSETFFVIILAFLFSRAISNSGIARKLLEPILLQYVNNPIKLMAAVVISTFVFIFLIPQPFSRVIILAGIFFDYMKSTSITANAREKILFLVFLVSVFVNMILLQGDIILNYAVLDIGQLNLTAGEWLVLMGPPTSMTLLILLGVYFMYAGKELRKISAYGGQDRSINKIRLNTADKRNIIVIGVIVLVWATEGIHGISGVWIVGVGSLIMFVLRLLKRIDIKAINLDLLVFLTAVLAIGKVMTASGTAGKLFSNIGKILPPAESAGFLIAVMGITMVSHMLLGSNLTTQSVVIPGLLSLSVGFIDPVLIVLTVFVTAVAHFLLPMHNVIILIGYSERFYSQRVVVYFGIILTVVVMAAIPLFYFPWWRFLGY